MWVMFRQKEKRVTGSPGLETDEKPEQFDTLLVHAGGTTRIFAGH